MTTTLDGTYNFRDTGGTPLTGGGVTASGVLYRSDALSGLTPTGLDQLAASDIGVIADFRTPQEKQMAPDRLPTSRPFRVVDLPLLEGAMTGMAQQAAKALAQGGDAAAHADAINVALAQIGDLGSMYTSMLQSGAQSFAQLARLVGAATVDPPTAVLVHCSAGKDRTGVATALMLDAAGAERDAVVADYASSQQHLAGPWADNMIATIEKMGIPMTDQLRTLVTSTPASAIERAFVWIDGQGGSAAYLKTGGLTDDELAALRARLAG